MAATHFLPDANGSTERPALISALGVLTFINCGFFVLVYALGLITMAAIQQIPLAEYQAMVADQIAAMPMTADLPEQRVHYIAELMHRSGTALMFILLVRTALRLYGAVGMWRGPRAGCHLYAAAQLVGNFAPHLVLPFEFLRIGGPLLAVATTALYGTQRHRLS